jgi:hypothetical protein
VVAGHLLGDEAVIRRPVQKGIGELIVFADVLRGDRLRPESHRATPPARATSASASTSARSNGSSVSDSYGALARCHSIFAARLVIEREARDAKGKADTP